MPRYAHSAKRKHRINPKVKDELYEHAVERYQHTDSGARKVCEDIEDEHFSMTGEVVTLSHTTVLRLSHGGIRLSQFNSGKCALGSEEQDEVIEYLIDLAYRGFPLSHRRLREVVDAIGRARYGSAWRGVGKNWTFRFMNRVSDRLQTYRSRPRDNVRARAANPYTKEAFFTLFKDTCEAHHINDDLIYAADETGIQTGIGQSEKVIGPTGLHGGQPQQRSGSRENITVLCTICADGTSLAPVVVMKGEEFQSSWDPENNPLNIG